MIEILWRCQIHIIMGTFSPLWTPCPLKYFTSRSSKYNSTNYVQLNHRCCHIWKKTHLSSVRNPYHILYWLAVYRDSYIGLWTSPYIQNNQAGFGTLLIWMSTKPQQKNRAHQDNFQPPWLLNASSGSIHPKKCQQDTSFVIKVVGHCDASSISWVK